MEKVAVDKSGRAWETVLNRRLASNIYGHCYSLEEEKLHTCTDIYANYKPDSSWEQVFQGLYEGSELEAAKEAKAFLQQKGVCYSVGFHPVKKKTNWCMGLGAGERNEMSE